MSELIYKEDAKEYVRYALENGLNPVEFLDNCIPVDVGGGD